ncbi:MAG: LysM domain-containing protein [Chloroflexia bacterium]
MRSNSQQSPEDIAVSPSRRWTVDGGRWGTQQHLSPSMRSLRFTSSIIHRPSSIVYRPILTIHRPPSTVLSLLLLLSLTLTTACGGTGDPGDPVNLVTTPVPSATTPPEALPTLPPVTSTVKPGDTLSGIADLFGITVDDLVRANNIADPNSLQVGQVLIIPGRAPTAAPAITPSTILTTTQTPSTVTVTVTTTVIVATPTNALPPPDVTPPLGPTEETDTP